MKTIKIHVAAVALFGLGLAACKSAETPPPPKPVVQAPVKPKEEVKPADKVGAANAIFAKGDYAKALESYEAILQKEPDNESAMFNKAVCLQRLGQNAEAKKAYEAVLAKAPDDVDAAMNIGAILKDEGKYDEGITVYNKALK